MLDGAELRGQLDAAQPEQHRASESPLPTTLTPISTAATRAAPPKAASRSGSRDLRGS